ncbi:hypothetical protein REI38_001135 [Salmonella enterica]|nr:hypothetical protein [Salmonella enterica]EJL7735806.1 hypothetical protein [Salmonella enterica]EJU7914903.1 hypothetical protein [Salmonella enterica]EKM4803909.1 hypothetical protein [Salmonella enterica]EKZ2067041.1 hypothetical protein [Salmonella enterica]
MELSTGEVECVRRTRVSIRHRGYTNGSWCGQRESTLRRTSINTLSLNPP